MLFNTVPKLIAYYIGTHCFLGLFFSSLHWLFARFIAAVPENSPDWQAILSSIKATLGGNLKPATLRTAIQTYFRIS